MNCRRPRTHFVHSQRSSTAAMAAPMMIASVVFSAVSYPPAIAPITRNGSLPD
jgi:hypothetical protein